ncbi:hypothetical protein [Cetobacterium sp. 2G large]|uniref:hypothetical protein n=1 Tax=Cetobacterium sp. 2G large TaxID=2759680 RepID=UPI00163C446C|nr:hypothetical protein [Cetobacterium sp. 2G large]MBC2853451.1 hypothetical protein [Cetobacterium sp. 2G large]
MEKIINILNTNNYSINLKSDYNNKSKINSYYPTFNNMRLLDKVLLSIDNKTNGSIILSGAYGTGKSYFTALLLSILSSKLKLSDYSNLIEKSKKVYGIEESLKNHIDKKYLIVFIDESMDNFSEGVFSGIRKALKAENINIKISSKIDIIQEKLEYWKENHLNIYIQFEEELTKLDFFKELKYKTKKTEDIFSKVYSDIFAGEEYSYRGQIKNLKNLLEDVENGVKEKGFSGVFYVFDEFGRYLETNIDNLDVKEIQDMAEYCNLQNNSNLFMITHKDIFQYTRKLKNNVEKDEWEKVSGRFLKEHLILEKDSILKILKNIIQKNNYEDYRENNLNIKTKELLLENILEHQNTLELTKDFFPLDYITATMLPDLSQKLAQNERTLFAFICSDEWRGLKSIISDKKNRKDFITLDYLYDYFERELKQLPVDSKEYKIYLSSQDILSKIPTAEEFYIKVIKTIAIIYVNNNLSEIKPDTDTLRYIFNKELLDLSYLEEKKLIVFKKYQNQYALLEDVNLNIEKLVEEYCETKVGRFDYVERLEQELNRGVYYPLKYNDLNKINRYFGQYFVDISNLEKLEKIKQNKNEDGRLIYFTNIEGNSNYCEVLKELKENKDFIFIGSKENRLDIYQELKELEAIDFIKKEDKNYLLKDSFRIELEIYQREIKENITKKLLKYFSEKINLLEITHEYLEVKYPKYLGVNYELINKRNISVPMKKARYEILKKLDQNIELKEDYFKDTKAESSVARVLLYNTGIYYKDLENENYKKFKNLMDEISEDIKKEKQTFEKLYMNYCSNLGKYGLREGVFTFLLGLIYLENKDDLALSLEDGNIEIDFTLDLLDIIEKNPEKYSLSHYKIVEKEIRYMQDLEILLKNYINTKDLKIYNRVLEGLKNFLLNQPRYVGNIYLSKVKGLNKIFRNIFTINNSREFILEDLLKIYKSKNYKDVTINLEKEIIELEEWKLNFINTLEKTSVEILSENKFDNLKDYLKKIDEKNTSNEIEQFIKSIKEKNKILILMDLTKKIKGFSYENWRTTEDLNEYKELLIKEVSKKIEEAKSINEELDMMEKMLSSKIQAVLKNMGFSLTQEQKKKVMTKILLEM